MSNINKLLNKAPNITGINPNSGNYWTTKKRKDKTMGLLPTEKSEKNLNLSDQIILVYGRAKIGKSTFCAQFEDAIFLATEPGLNHLEVYKNNITSWQQFLGICGELAKGDHKFKTVVIDTIDQLIPLLMHHVEEENEVDYIGDMPMGKGWFQVTQELSRTLIKLSTLPYGLILVSHAKQEEVETKTSKFNRYTIDIGGKNQNAILNLMDMILFMDSEMRGGEEISVMRTKPSMYWQAGDKSKLLDTTIEFPPANPEVAYEVIHKCFNGVK